MNDAAVEAPIFIVGFSRSGTSLLRAMLNAHPAIHIAQESAFYQWSRPDRLRGCRTARDWFQGYARTASFRLQGLDPGAIAAQIPAELPRAEVGRVVLPLVLRARAARLGRVRWGDKTPLHSQRLDAIFADFPDARVIHVVRHPVPTVASILRMPWGSDSALLNAVLYRGVAEDVAKQGERVRVLRLEDLIADPRGSLESILAYIGEPLDERVLHHADQDAALDPPLPWLSQASGALRADTRPLGLDPARIRLIERITASAMARYGYQATPQEREPSFGETLRAVTGDLGRGLRFLIHALRTAPPMDPPEKLDAMAQLRWLFQLNSSAEVPARWREIPEPIRRQLEGPRAN